MPLSDYQRQRCISILDDLQSYSISKMFAQPVDPVRDNVPNYFDIVKKPMDLGTVREKLMNNQYNSVAEWKEDMDLIWKNSLQVNPKGTILGIITTDMQLKYQSLVKFLTDSPDSDWINQLYALKDDLNGIRVNTNAPNSSKREPRQPKQSKSIQSKQTKQKKQQPLTRAEILKLTDDINGLENEIHILSIFEVFRKYEPQIETDGDTLKLDIALLKPSTLWALRETVDSLLGLA